MGTATGYISPSSTMGLGGYFGYSPSTYSVGTPTTSSNSYINPSSSNTAKANSFTTTPTFNYSLLSGSKSQRADALKSAFDSGAITQAQFDSGMKELNQSGFSKLLNDPNRMEGITGLASVLMQAIALPSMLKNARLQNEALGFNLATAREEQGRRNDNISGFNAFRQA